MQHQAVIPRVRSEYVLVPDRYEYNRVRPLKWLQRSCIWVLDKLGCQSYGLETSIEYMRIGFDDIVDLVMRQRRAVEAIAGHGCKYLLLGREQMRELVLSDQYGQTMFQFPPDYRASVHPHPMMFAGLNVVLVPWFDGVICLEELS